MPISVSDTDPPDSGKLTDHVSVGVLTRIVSRSVVDEVLAETGRVQKRTRSLPAHVVVYFVLALALFADGYEEVIRKLVDGLICSSVEPGMGGAEHRGAVAGPTTT